MNDEPPGTEQVDGVDTGAGLKTPQRTVVSDEVPDEHRRMEKKINRRSSNIRSNSRRPVGSGVQMLFAALGGIQEEKDLRYTF
ncbi:hypothetical protein HMPREF1624_05538 [Sporothrix schenckii ATCC 58251]|uniref:Uncharacterized protein n=1 Tax=Sporothrix schenckii (strain ATCC 58251 / de Perez 2211183) TaxID=1391915 RepID=U7PW87_SPOS1|nr:hypothetical protein HMPREF1624_05538 [Sporothrix schenckii ATCC 58251]